MSAPSALSLHWHQTQRFGQTPHCMLIYLVTLIRTLPNKLLQPVPSPLSHHQLQNTIRTSGLLSLLTGFVCINSHSQQIFQPFLNNTIMHILKLGIKYQHNWLILECMHDYNKIPPVFTKLTVK